MTSTRRPRPKLLLPTTLVAVAVLILCGLGTWQVYRLQWKEGILAQIAAAEQKPPAPVTDHPPAFGRVTATGRFNFDQTARYSVDVRETPKGSILGYYQVVPLDRPDGPPVLVNRGWVPDLPEAKVNEPAGAVTVTGFVRLPTHRGWFTPDDDLAKRQFYELDPTAIAKTVGAGQVMPFTLTVLGTVPFGQYPIPASDFPRPPNNHLSYAITWYSLAAMLIVVYVLRVRSMR